jgi:integrase
MIENYIAKLKANKKSHKTIESYEYVLNRLNKFKPVEQMKEKDMIEFFNTFEGTPQTMRLFQGIIKKFYIDNGKPEVVNWIQLVNIKIVSGDKNTLLVEDINEMIEATISPYWKGYISVIFETGSRFNELRAVKWLDFKDNILEISTTKTGAGTRRIPLIMSGNYLRNLQVSISDAPNDLIFPYSESHVLVTLKEIAKKAGINKSVNPHRFRHSRATDLVRRGVQESIIRKILGWTPTSTMIARYQHLSDNSIVNAMTNGDHEIETPDLINAPLTLKDDMEKIKNENEMLQEKMSAMEEFINSIAEQLGEQPRKIGMRKVWKKV